MMATWQQDYLELPEFLRFNKYGGVLSKDERERVAKTKGVCSTCGKATHKVTAFRSIPIDNEDVNCGVCLTCHPDQRREQIHPLPTTTSSKAAALLGVGDDDATQDSDLATVVSSERIARQRQRRFGLSKSMTLDEPLPEGTSSKAAAVLGGDESQAGDDLTSAVAGLTSAVAGVKMRRKVRLGPRRGSDDRHEPGHVERTSDLASIVHGFKAAKKVRTRVKQRGAQTFGGMDDKTKHEQKNARQQNRRFLSERPADDIERMGMLGADPRSFHSEPDKFSRIPSLMNRGQSVRSKESAESIASWAKDAWDLVKDMRSHPDDVPILTSRLNRLKDIGASQCLQAGSLYETIEVMRRFPEERYLQLAGIGALWSLSADGNVDGKIEVLDAGGGEVIVTALRNFPKDVTLISKGLGSLANLGEGMGGRAQLVEEKATEAAASALKTFYDEEGAAEVLYWSLKCLFTLVSDHSDEQSSHVDMDSTEREEDRAALENCRDAVLKADALHTMLDAIQTAPMDGISLELAFKLLSQFDQLENHLVDARDMLIGACEKAIQMQPHAFVPTLHDLACAILCLALRMGKADPEESTKMACNFVGVSFRAVISYGQHHSAHSTTSSSGEYQPPHSPYAMKMTEVMFCTLSTFLCNGGITLGSQDSEDVLNICSAALEHERSSAFALGCCVWIIWSVFVHGIAVETTGVVLHAAEAIVAALPNIEGNPDLLTVGLSALSEAAELTDIEADPLVVMIVHVVSKYSNVETLRQEACKLLFALCKTRDDAIYIVDTGGLDVVKKPLGESLENCRTTVHFMIKLSALAGDEIFSLEELTGMINASVRLKNDSILAAKSWLSFLTSSITPNREDFAGRAPMAIGSIKEVMGAFPKHLNLQRYACAALRNMAASIQRAKIQVDISRCFTPLFHAQIEHGVRIHKECLDALWALMGVQCELEPIVMREVIYLAIEVTEIHVVSNEFAYSDAIVSAGLAVMAETLLNHDLAIKVLGENLVDIVVDVVNKCLYSYLDRREGQPSIFEHGFRTLHRLCNDATCKSIIVSHGGIVAVVDGMLANSENALIQQLGCSILWRLAGDDLGMKLSVVEADGVDVIMNVMITHGGNAGVVSEAFQAMNSLCVDRSSRNFIAKQGGIMLISNSMSALAQKFAVQQTGLAALCNLALDADESLMDPMFSVVHDLLDRRVLDVTIQKLGIVLIRNISVRSESSQQGILSSGCLKNVMKAVEVHANCAEIVLLSLSILVNLTESGVWKVMLEKKAVKLAVHAMMLHIEDLKIAMVGCRLLDVIHEKTSRGNSTGGAGVEAAIYAMNVHRSSEFVQDMGCRVLASASSGATEKAICDLDFECLFRTTLSAIQGFPTCFTIQKMGITSLRNLLEVSENANRVKSKHRSLQDSLAAAKNSFPELAGICQELIDRIDHLRLVRRNERKIRRETSDQILKDEAKQKLKKSLSGGRSGSELIDDVENTQERS